MPPKADPFHNGNIESDYRKISLQKGEIGIDDVTNLTPKEVVTPPVKTSQPEKSKTPPNPNGRPKFAIDTEPRKQKRVLPKTKPGLASLMVWSGEAQKTIANIINPAMLNHYKKKNLRELTKAELNDLEDIKFKVLCNIQPYDNIDDEKIALILEQNPNLSQSQKLLKSELKAEFIENQGRAPSIDELRHINNLAYSFDFFNEK